MSISATPHAAAPAVSPLPTMWISPPTSCAAGSTSTFDLGRGQKAPDLHPGLFFPDRWAPPSPAGERWRLRAKRWRPVELDIVENNNRLILFYFYVFCKNEAANRSQQFSVSSPHGRWWQPKSRGRRAPRDGQIFILA